jgi:hypothetical protein
MAFLIWNWKFSSQDGSRHERRAIERAVDDLSMMKLKLREILTRDLFRQRLAPRRVIVTPGLPRQ